MEGEEEEEGEERAVDGEGRKGASTSWTENRGSAVEWPEGRGTE